MDSGDKGTAKAMSVAYRILLLQSLIIPTDDRDPDQDSYERAVAPNPDPIVEARVAVKDAWEANRGEFHQAAVEKDFTAWTQGEVLLDAPAQRLLDYADHLKQEAGA
jgi:hypothetical protein